MGWLITAAILIVTMILILWIYQQWISKSGTEVGKTQEGVFRDCDKDGISDILDRCCDTTGGEVDFQGCTGKETEKKACSAIDACKA